MKGLTKRLEQVSDVFIGLFLKPKFILAYAIFAMASLFFGGLGADPDLFARVAAGRLIDLNGYVTDVDPFAFTPKKTAWIDHEWFSGWIFYHLSQIGGDWALFSFKNLMVAYSLYFLWCAQRIVIGKEAQARSFLWFLLPCISASYVWQSTVRAQVFTYFFLPVFLFSFVSFSRQLRRRYLMLLPVCMLVWANSHGGFVVGLGLLGLFAIAMTINLHLRSWPVWLSLGLCIACTFVNPYGLKYWQYIFEAVTMPRASISEWAVLSPFSTDAFYINLFFLIGLYSIYKHRNKLDWEFVLLFIASAFYGYKHYRLMAILGMVMLVYKTDSFNSILDAAEKLLGRYYLMLKRSGALVLIGVMPVMLWPWLNFLINPSGFSLNYSGYPRAALNWLQGNYTGGRLLVDFNNGSFAHWRLYPNFLISLDGRYEEVYPESTVQLVSQALDVENSNFKVAFAKVNPDYVLLDVGTSSFKNYQAFGGQWKIVYQDSKYAILANAQPKNPSERVGPDQPIWSAF